MTKPLRMQVSNQTKMKNQTSNVKTKTRPVKILGYSSVKLQSRRDKRREEAEIRQDRRNLLSLGEKISATFLRPGKSYRERARLQGADPEVIRQNEEWRKGIKVTE